jgi:hypothetical protein|eukprot:scaffold253_cov267-Chaetoceros_neogracile.AAC.10
MSAYALPGSFFFPSTTAATDAKKGNESEPGSNDESMSDQTAHRSETQESWSNDLLISIKSASIDHIRLIQGFTALRQSGNSSNRRSIRDRMASLSNSLPFSLSSSMTESDDHWGEYGYEEDNLEEESSNSPSNSPQKSKVQFNFDEMDSSPQRSSITSGPICTASVTQDCAVPVCDSSNAQDDAIQFTLSISFNGRKYTATRALPSFVKLRNDLMLELANRKKTSVRFQNPSDQDVFYESKQAHGEEEDVVIPELPIGGDQIDDGKSSGLMGMAGRGFRGLQDTVKQFCPPMEDWIQSVAALVPSSPTLANFLWEPLHNNQDATFENANATSPSSKPIHTGNKNHSSMRNSLRNSVQTLNSITEAWGETDNEDEVDQACLDDDGEEFFG